MAKGAAVGGRQCHGGRVRANQFLERAAVASDVVQALLLVLPYFWR